MNHFSKSSALLAVAALLVAGGASAQAGRAGMDGETMNNEGSMGSGTGNHGGSALGGSDAPSGRTGGGRGGDIGTDTDTRGRMGRELMDEGGVGRRGESGAIDGDEAEMNADDDRAMPDTLGDTLGGAAEDERSNERMAD